jgi:hypothetical protein
MFVNELLVRLDGHSSRSGGPDEQRLKLSRPACRRREPCQLSAALPAGIKAGRQSCGLGKRGLRRHEAPRDVLAGSLE